jgi:adenylylsulfate kinase-like enzyme
MNDSNRHSNIKLVSEFSLLMGWQMMIPTTLFFSPQEANRTHVVQSHDK